MKKSRIDVVSAIPGDERHDVSDDDLIVEDGGTKGEYNQRQQRYECTSQDIRDKLGILMAL